MTTPQALASGLDDANAILCDWAEGTGAQEWMDWLDQYAIPYQAGRIILAAVAGTVPRTWEEYTLMMDCCCEFPDDYSAGSDLGGGSECCRWYEVGESIIGYGAGFCWCIPADADEPPTVTIMAWREGDEPED